MRGERAHPALLPDQMDMRAQDGQSGISILIPPVKTYQVFMIGPFFSWLEVVGVAFVK